MKIKKFITTLLVWIVCLIAITSSVVLMYQWHKNRGVVIQIRFDDASGLVPLQSKIMYVGVQIGLIEDIIMDPNSTDPLVIARVSRQVAKMLGPESKFWVIRAQLGIGNIANLSTITTGDYIALQPVQGAATRKFVGLEHGPVDQIIHEGIAISLSTTNASGLNVAGPILYRGVQIGHIDSMRLAKNLSTVKVIAHIDKEYVGVIRKDTYFANVSGFHASLHVFGASKISMDSFKTLVSGGINAYTPSLNSPKACNGDSFKLLTNEQFQAMHDN